MKIQVVSDLHLASNYEYHYKIQPRADYLVLGGDIGVLADSTHVQGYLGFLTRYCDDFKGVFLISGNGEPRGYRIGWKKALKTLRGFVAHPSMKGRLNLLENDSFSMEKYGYNVVILGCTLWSRLRKDQPEAGSRDRAEITSWTRATTISNFENSYKWIQGEVRRSEIVLLKRTTES